MQLIKVIDDYVRLQRLLGLRFDSAHRLLRQFDREMGSPDITIVPRGVV